MTHARSRLPLYLAPATAGGLLAGVVPTGCAPDDESIVIVREVLIPVPAGIPNAIIRLPDGGFAIAGETTTAWAVRTNANGAVLWKYADPHDERIKVPDAPSESSFKGIVPLEDGKLLFCGNKRTPERLRSSGFLLILDSNGKLIEQRLVLPGDDPRYDSAGFGQCLRWNGEITLVGGAVIWGVDPAFGWLMRLNESGSRRSELVSQKLALAPAVEMPDHTLMLTKGTHDPGNALILRGVKMVRVDAQGQVLDTKTLEESDFSHCLIQSLSSHADVRLITYAMGSGKASLHTLNGRLEEVAPARSIPSISAENLCGYALDDDSIVLFGSVMSSSVSRAAVAWVARPHAHDAAKAFPLVDVRDSAPKINATVALSSREFVAIRQQISSVSPQRNGLVMSWVSLR